MKIIANKNKADIKDNKYKQRQETETKKKKPQDKKRNVPTKKIYNRKYIEVNSNKDV